MGRGDGWGGMCSLPPFGCCWSWGEEETGRRRRRAVDFGRHTTGVYAVCRVSLCCGGVVGGGGWGELT